MINDFSDVADKAKQTMSGAAHYGGEAAKMVSDKAQNLFSVGSQEKDEQGRVKDQTSQDTPIGGKVNALRQAITGRGTGTDEFKYPLRFSDEHQLGPNRETLETSSNVSESINAAVGMAKTKVKEAMGQVERKEQVK